MKKEIKCSNCSFWKKHRKVDEKQYGICSSNFENTKNGIIFESSKWIPEVKIELGTHKNFSCLNFNKK